MPSTSRRPLTAVALVVAVVLAVAVGAQAAVSSQPLPDVPADELLASVLRVAEDPPPMSGELSATLGLGLPDLPDDVEDGALGDLLGDSRLRVERSGDGLRAALLAPRSERLVVTDGETVSTWDSSTLQVTRATLPSHGEADDGLPHAGPGPLGLSDPMSLTIPLVDVLRRDAEVHVDGTARVAGRDAHRLVVAPADELTTLGRVELDIDGDTRVPLRVALFARGAEAPSIALAWTRVSFDPIDPGVFDFAPPPGAEVTELDVPDSHRAGADATSAERLPALSRALGAAGTSAGSGWSAVAVLPAPPDLGRAGLLLPLDGPLLSLRTATADGRPVLLAGLVPLSRLDEVAAELR